MSFRVLSIDGGGMRGIYSAAYLAALEQGFCKDRNYINLDIILLPLKLRPPLRQGSRMDRGGGDGSSRSNRTH